MEFIGFNTSSITDILIPVDNSPRNLTETERHTLFLMSIHNPEIDRYRLAYLTTGIIMAILMSLGNAIVLLLFYQERATLKITHKFVVSMALCDIITGLIFMPAQLYKFEMKVAVYSDKCPWILAVMVAIYQTSMYVLSASSVDRYWAIVHPMSYHVRATSKVANGELVSVSHSKNNIWVHFCSHNNHLLGHSPLVRSHTLADTQETGPS